MTAEENNLPLDLQHPGGFVEETMTWINETAVCPQPIFALASALCLAGTIFGRHVQDESGQRTNLYLMGVGYTSCGKDHALKAVARALDACEASGLRLGQVTSDSAVEYALRRNPRFAMLIDEAGHFFANVSNAKTFGSPLQSLKPALLELWSCANSRWKGKQRVPKNEREAEPVLIDNPHVCLFGMTQPQIFFEGASKTDLRDGWLARNLFFISKTRPKPHVLPQGEVPVHIRREVMCWTAPSESVRTIPADDGAKAAFEAFNDEVYWKMLKADKTGDETNYLYGKALENARRIALVLAVGRDGKAAVVTERDADYACRLVRYLVGDLIRAVRETVSESPDEKAKKRIVQIVADAGSGGISRNELTRKTQFIRKSFRDEYLADLIESGELVMTTGTRGMEIYRIGN